MKKLNQSVIETITKDKNLKIGIQNTLKISHTTMYKYLKVNDPRLLQLNVIDFLVKETGLTQNQIVCK